MTTEVKPTATWKVVVAWIIVMVPLLWGIGYSLRDSIKLLETR